MSIEESEKILEILENIVEVQNEKREIIRLLLNNCQLESAIKVFKDLDVNYADMLEKRRQNIINSHKEKLYTDKQFVQEMNWIKSVILVSLGSV